MNPNDLSNVFTLGSKWRHFKGGEYTLEEVAIVQQTEHSCPDCAATLKVFVERLPATGELRTIIEHVRHNV